jgi:hypothetical protein
MHSVPSGWSFVAAGAGMLYAYSGIDLIPNSTPWIGHADEIAFFLGGLMLAYKLARPRAALRQGRKLPDWLRFRIRVLRADLANFFFIQHRDVDGFLVSGKNSGSHWLKFMLSAALAAKHGLEPPVHSTGPAAEAIIGHPSRPRHYPHVPRIGTTHTIPSALLRLVPPWLVRRPPIVLLVRAIDTAMLSNYAKWQAQYEVSLTDYAHGDAGGRRFVADAWWYVHFFNRWGAWVQADPDRILVVRYEELMADTAYWLQRIADHFNLGLDSAALEAGLAFSSKTAIRSRQDPLAGETVVGDGTQSWEFGAADREAIQSILRRFLRFDFGYGALPAIRQAETACANVAGVAHDVAGHVRG